MNLRLAGGTAVIGRASGFLNTEACTTHGLAIRLVVTLAQTSLRKPSRAKQELRDLNVPPLGGQGAAVTDFAVTCASTSSTRRSISARSPRSATVCGDKDVRGAERRPRPVSRPALPCGEVE